MRARFFYPSRGLIVIALVCMLVGSGVPVTPFVQSNFTAAASSAVLPVTPHTDALLQAAPSDESELSQGSSDFFLEMEVTPQRIRAGDPITYTYRYRNDTATTATNVRLVASWADFGKQGERTGGSAADQFCLEDPDIDPAENLFPCDVLAGSVVGPTITKEETQAATTLGFSIGDIGAGQSGEFQIVLDTNRTIYPEVDSAQLQLSGSASLFVDSAQPVAETTIAGLVVGPLFSLTKALNPESVLYPDEGMFAGEVAELIITVGNAVEDPLRADAMDATNVIVREVLPRGSEFVTPTAPTDFPFLYIPEQNEIRFFVGTVPRGQQAEIRVQFRKLNNTDDCNNLENREYLATSDEMPIAVDNLDPDANLINTIGIAGERFRVPLLLPVVITDIEATPERVQPGQQSTISISVASFYPEAITNLQLVYDIQTSGYYITETATPEPSLYPTDIQPGGRIGWTFDIDGTDDYNAPTELTFQLTISTTVQGRDTAAARFIVLEDETSVFPSACLESRNGAARVERPDSDTIDIEKTVNVEARAGNVYLLEDQGETVRFTILVDNPSNRPLVDLEILDTFPEIVGGSFDYVEGSAQPAPDEVLTTEGGGLRWRGLTIPPSTDSGPFEITYEVVVTGEEYYDFCNVVEGMLPADNQGFELRQPREVCVKINPDIEYIKEPATQAALPGEEVKFDLTLINNTNNTYTLGLVDYMLENGESVLEFVRVDSSRTYGGNPNVIPDLEEFDGTLVLWDRVTVGPGGRLDASFFAKLPDGDCPSNGIYRNQVLMDFTSPQTGNNYLVERTPPVEVEVQCINRVVEFDQRVLDTTEVGLEDLFTYEIRLRNRNGVEAMNNARVEFIMPRGFLYDSPSANGSDMADRPTIDTTRPDGRHVLTWSVPSIEASQQYLIRFVARAGQLVGTQQALLRVTDPANQWLLQCRSGSLCVPEGDLVYAASTVQVKALHTAEPRLILPGGDCLATGQNLTYQLSLVNSNQNTEYTNTTIGVTLSLGLRYTGLITDASQNAILLEPEESLGPNGETVLTWQGLVIPEATRNGSTQRDVFIGLEIGNVLEDLTTRVSVISPDGLIPLKEDVVDPGVELCDPGNQTNVLAVALEPNPAIAEPGDELVYQIELLNFNTFQLNVNARAVLPTPFSYVAMLDTSGVTAPPDQSGQQLTWNNITVPPRTGSGDDTRAGRVVILYRVLIDTATEIDQNYSSSVSITQNQAPQVELEDDRRTVNVFVTQNLESVYLPLVIR
ncbi:MAG: DUF11 domain-containing protein [Chloroflexaceae bacterium]|nr:DUF11 domain-containing protein [Chloroflexaceae bacterium]